MASATSWRSTIWHRLTSSAILSTARSADYLDKHEFLELLRRRALPKVDVVFHQGACSDTMQTDGRYMMENNYRFSVELLRWCQDINAPLVYASSAAVYGLGPRFAEERACEKPLNIYGYSKFLFDSFVRRQLDQLSAPRDRFALFQCVRATRIAQRTHGIGRLSRV